MKFRRSTPERAPKPEPVSFTLLTADDCHYFAGSIANAFTVDSAFTGSIANAFTVAQDAAEQALLPIMEQIKQLGAEDNPNAIEVNYDGKLNTIVPPVSPTGEQDVVVVEQPVPRTIPKVLTISAPKRKKRFSSWKKSSKNAVAVAAE